MHVEVEWNGEKCGEDQFRFELADELKTISANRKHRINDG